LQKRLEKRRNDRSSKELKLWRSRGRVWIVGAIVGVRHAREVKPATHDGGRGGSGG